MRFILLAFAITVLSTTSLRAEDPAPAPMPTKAKFLITGLHCQPCTRTVEASLKRVPGVRSVSVDWNLKNATVEFDETQLSAQAIAQRIAVTPHMMGGNMRYGGWLALRVDDVRDAAKAELAKATLSKKQGVAAVVVYPAQGAVGVRFDAAGKVTSAELVQALEAAGLKASNLK